VAVGLDRRLVLRPVGEWRWLTGIKRLLGDISGDFSAFNVALMRATSVCLVEGSTDGVLEAHEGRHAQTQTNEQKDG